MQVDVAKEKLCVNKIVGQKNDCIVVEGDMIVPDIKPDILNTISTTGNVCIYKKEVLEGKVRIDGEVNVYVIYLADNEEESTRSLNTTLDFTQIIDFENCNTGMSLDENMMIKSIECKILNGRKISVKANLQFEGTVYSNENVDILKQVNNLEDIQSLESNLMVNSLVGEGITKTYAKDTIMIENIDNLAEILKTDLAIVNKDMKISYNKVLGKAEVSAKIMYLTEDNRIKVVESKIPIMGFVDIENVTEENICDMKYRLKNIVVKPNSVEEHSIYIEVEIELCCRVYETKEIRVIEDLYSPSECLNFNQRSIHTMSNKCCNKSVCHLREKVSIPELNGNQLYDVEIRPVILNRNIVHSKVMLEGEVDLKFIFATNSLTGVSIKEITLPFDHQVEIAGIQANTNIEIEIEVGSQNFTIGTDSMIDGAIDLEFSLNISNMLSINMIDEVTIDETRDKQIYSMVIYFVKPGDTLWKIAKQFGSTISDIVRVNKIEDENKIYQGQQLFIPKYVYTKREVSA